MDNTRIFSRVTGKTKLSLVIPKNDAAPRAGSAVSTDLAMRYAAPVAGTTETNTSVAQAGAVVVAISDYLHRKKLSKSYRLLLADDGLNNRRPIARELERAGHRVTFVGDGEQALDALIEADFDVLILDVDMPVMGGLEATRLIRVMQAGTVGVSIIMFAHDTTSTAVREARDAGVDLLLPKPVELNTLYAAIAMLAEKGAQPMRKVAP